MGKVYKALDTTLDRTVAIKVLESAPGEDRQPYHRQFLREVRAVSKIDHPNVVMLYEILSEGNTNFMVMQYLDGVSLRQMLNERSLGWQEAVRIAGEVGAGLQAAHRVGVIHRDIKPENIMVTASGSCRVLDFGIAHLVDRSTWTEEGKIIGTMPYMSPEQIQGEPLDERADIYSLGVVLFEMICSRLPFDVRAKAALFYQIVNVEPPAVAEFNQEVPDGLVRIVAKALRKNPAERYQTIAGMLHDLNIISRRLESGSAVGEGEMIARRKKFPRSTLWLGAAVLVMLTLFLVRFESGARVQKATARVLVLRWENPGADSSIDWLSGTIMDGLISALSWTEGCQVMSRQTAMSVLDRLEVRNAGVTPTGVLSAAREAGADYLVTGSYERREQFLAVSCTVNDLAGGRIMADWEVSIIDLGSDLSASIDQLAGLVARTIGVGWRDRSAGQPNTIASLTPSLAALKLYQKAMAYCEAGNQPAAIDNFKLATEADEKFTAAYLQLARLTPSEDEQSRYFTLAMKYRRSAPHPLCDVVEADFLTFKGAPRKAIDRYNRILEKYPEENSARSALAVLYMLSRQFYEATAEFEVMQITNPFDYSFYPYWWIADIEIGRPDKALAILDHWRGQMPREEGPIRTLIRYYENQGDYETALSLCDSLAARRSGADLFFRGFLLLYVGRAAAAERCFRALMRTPDPFIQPDRVYSYLGYLFYKTARYHEGTELIEKTRPGERGTYFHWIAGLLAAGQGDLDTAEGHAAEIKKRFDNTTENLTMPEALAEKRFYFNLEGEIALAGREPERAVQLHEIALSHSSRADEAFFRFYLGNACLAARRTQQAKEQFQQVLAVNPRFPEALLRLGRLYLADGQRRPAGPILETLDQIWKEADSDFQGRKELDRLLTLLKSS